MSESIGGSDSGREATVDMVDASSTAEEQGASKANNMTKTVSFDVLDTDSRAKDSKNDEFDQTEEAITDDLVVNEIQMGFEKTIDTEVLENVDAMVSRRRRDLNLQRQVNLAVDLSETGNSKSLTNDAADVEQDDNSRAEAKRSAIPVSVTKRFLRVDDKFYFPDETLAFLDKGESLRARAEHKEVVTALVAIADARGWSKITVKGSEVFRRAVWMEAALRGIDARGYKPTEVETAKLEAALAKGAGKPTSSEAEKLFRSLDNIIEKGHDKDVAKNLDNTQHKEFEKIAGVPLRQHSGILVAHGQDHYKHDPQESINYWVTLRGDNGKEETIWGKDLARSFADSDADFKIGDKMNIAFMGNVPVTVKTLVRDNKGVVIGEQEVETHRNEWDVRKADSFRNTERAEAIKNHPDLVGAYGTMAAAKAFATEKFPNKFLQDKFIAATKEAVAQRIETGKKVPSPKIASKQIKNTEVLKERKIKDNVVER